MNQIAKEILIKTKRKLFSANLGNNQSQFLGNGMDFSELREYHYGDDVRKINHKASAKEQKPYINLFNEERELNIVLVFMVGGSIYFGTKRLKQELMAEILSLLAFSAIKNRDRVSTLFFSNKEEYFKKPSKNINILNEIVPEAIEIDPLKKDANYDEVANLLLHRVKQKSLIFIIGDFYKEIDFSQIARKHELFCIVVRDKFEEDPLFRGESELIDPVSLKEIDLNISPSILNEYKREIAQHDKKLFEHFLSNKIRYTKIYTDEDPFFKLNNLVR